MYYDYLIYIGRFQPFHNAHHFIIQQACYFSKKVIVFCGSTSKNRTLKNPFTYIERKTLLLSSLDINIRKKIHIFPLYDYKDDNIWTQSIYNNVQTIVEKNKKIKIGLIGHIKDSTSYYLQLFKDWPLITIKNFNSINATYIREVLFYNKNITKIQNCIETLIHPAVLKFILHFTKTKSYRYLSMFYN